MNRYLVGKVIAIALCASTFAVFALGQGAPPAGGGQGQAPGGLGARGGAGRGAPAAPAGPPAPVPPEVAIKRPTADEVTKINAALKRFVDANNSTDSALLKNMRT